MIGVSAYGMLPAVNAKEREPSQVSDVVTVKVRGRPDGSAKRRVYGGRSEAKPHYNLTSILSVRQIGMGVDASLHISDS